MVEASEKSKKDFPSGNSTRVTRVTGRYTNHYTNENHEANTSIPRYKQTRTHTPYTTLLTTTYLHPSRPSDVLHSMMPPAHLLTRNTAFATPASHHACRALSARITSSEHSMGPHHLSYGIGRSDEGNTIAIARFQNDIVS